MELRRLHYFIAVAEHLNFRRAAEVLNTAQPSLSQQIRALEDELGVMLFERTKQRVRLTNAGEEYLAGARALLADYALYGRRAREAHAGDRGSITVATHGMAIMRHLPDVVRSFRSEYPDVRVALSVMRNPDLLEAVRSGRIEIALASHVEEDAIVAVRPLWSFPWRVVLPIDHPMARRPAVRMSDLNGDSLIVLPPRGGADANSEVIALCRHLHFTPKSIIEIADVASFEALIGLVACGLGITIMPSSVEHIAVPDVTFKRIVGTKQAISITACWRKDALNPLIGNFVVTAARVFGIE